MMHRSIGATALLLALAGCGTTSGDNLHFGGALGEAFTQVSSDRRHPDPNLEHGDGHTPTGFLELGIADGDSLVLSRLTYLHTKHAIDQGLGTGSLDQVLAFGLWAPRVAGDDTLCLRPLVGVGLGFASLNTPPDAAVIGAHDWDSGVAALTLGAEVDFADHFTVGMMGWAGVAGVPGDTTGDIASVMFYGGVRF